MDPPQARAVAPCDNILKQGNKLSVRQQQGREKGGYLRETTLQTPWSVQNGGGVIGQFGGHLTTSQGQCTTVTSNFVTAQIVYQL